MTFTAQTYRALVMGSSKTNFTEVIPTLGNPPRQIGSICCSNIGSNDVSITLCIMKTRDKEAGDETIFIPGKVIPKNEVFVVEHHDYFLLNPGDKLVAYTNSPGLVNIHASVR